jgi:hypothetical protein
MLLTTRLSLQKKLDAVDRAQRALRDCPSNRDEIVQALDTIPQFVVVGRHWSRLCEYFKSFYNNHPVRRFTR